MKKSSTIEQQLAALRQQLTQAKKQERRIAERHFIKLAKSLGIFGLPAEQLTREFQLTLKSASSESPISLTNIQEADYEQA